MKIAIAGPYSSNDPQTRQENLLRLNKAAAEVLLLGHVPIVGVNAALPVIEQLGTDDIYESIMKISMGAIEDCDAILLIAESPGAIRETEYLRSKSKPVFRDINAIPKHQF